MTEGNGHTGNGGASQAAQAPGTTLTKKDFTSPDDVRWCPGCGDYAILSAVQTFMPELGLPREKVVFISGIGCSSRFPYYMETYGFHGIHGRAPALASGLAVTRPDLNIWVVTGDGDGLSIGGNHLIHAMRRNVNMTILLFNNQIYGLTKGQYSPTSEVGKVTKSTPFGSVDYPFNPVSLALGAECAFVARSIDTDRAHLTGVLRRAAKVRGTKFIEIYQNCNIFNDDAFIALTGRDTKKLNQIRLEQGKPIRFGINGEKGVAQDAGGLHIVDVEEVGEERLVVHDEHAVRSARAFALSKLSHSPTSPTPIGIFRDVERPVYEDILDRQITAAQERSGRGDLGRLLAGADSWVVD